MIYYLFKLDPYNRLCIFKDLLWLLPVRNEVKILANNLNHIWVILRSSRKLWNLAIIWPIRKSFQCILQGVRFLLAKQTWLSRTSDNESYLYCINTLYTYKLCVSFIVVLYIWYAYVISVSVSVLYICLVQIHNQYIYLSFKKHVHVHNYVKSYTDKHISLIRNTSEIHFRSKKFGPKILKY